MSLSPFTGPIDRSAHWAVLSMAPSYRVLMLGLALLGGAIGGFGSLSTAIVIRSLPKARAPQGLATLNVGNATAASIAAPLGSWLGDLIGWRRAFFLFVPQTQIRQWLGLPSLPAKGRARAAQPLAQARGPVAAGMAAMLALFIYLRPFLQSVAGFSVAQRFADRVGGGGGNFGDRPSAGADALSAADRHFADHGGAGPRAGRGFGQWRGTAGLLLAAAVLAAVTWRATRPLARGPR